MGIRIEFYQNNTAKSLKELLEEHYESFKKDFVAEQTALMKKCDLDAEDLELFGFLSLDRATKLDFERVDSFLLDTIAIAFVFSRKDLFKPIGSSVYKRYYEESSGMIEATRDTELKEMWEIVLHGRSISDGSTRSGFYQGTQLGFFSSDEQAVFREKIERYFGTGDLERYPAGCGLDCMAGVLRQIDFGKELLITIDIM
ncbi:hypothetical protein ACYULU_09385 [Breznakiellaceae bacterium SP9]